MADEPSSIHASLKLYFIRSNWRHLDIYFDKQAVVKIPKCAVNNWPKTHVPKQYRAKPFIWILYLLIPGLSELLSAVHCEAVCKGKTANKEFRQWISTSRLSLYIYGMSHKPLVIINLINIQDGFCNECLFRVRHIKLTIFVFLLIW